jgi:hypothetical protein
LLLDGNGPSVEVKAIGIPKLICSQGLPLLNMRLIAYHLF